MRVSQYQYQYGPCSGLETGFCYQVHQDRPKGFMETRQQRALDDMEEEEKAVCMHVCLYNSKLWYFLDVVPS